MLFQVLYDFIHQFYIWAPSRYAHILTVSPKLQAEFLFKRTRQIHNDIPDAADRVRSPPLFCLTLISSGCR